MAVKPPVDYPNPPPPKGSSLKEYVFPRVKGKPKVLMIADVKGWGAWRRGEYIKKHLSDEFEFDLVDLKTFNDNFKTFKNQDYTVLYVLLHILMRYRKVQALAKTVKTITTVTSRILLKDTFGYDLSAKVKLFRMYTKDVNIMIVNNLLVKPETEKYFQGPVRYAPRGVDPDVFKFIKYPMKGRFTVYYVGKPVKQKGLQAYIKPTCSATKARILINKRNYTNAMPESHMVEKYNDSNVYIVASTIDGTPNPALEAASCGRPIIANRIGNMPEFIEDGVNGFLVPLRTSAYIEKVQWMMENRVEAAAMGQRARETVLKGWTWDYILNKYQRHVLREVLS